MHRLLVVGGGLFGSQAAAYARSRGLEATVFDAGMDGSASPAAAGLFQEAWIGKKWRETCRHALDVLDELYGIRHLSLLRDDGSAEAFLFVPPSAILERDPCRARVSRIGDGWLEADGQRHDGWVYVAAGIWCGELVPGVRVLGKAGAAYSFSTESPGRIRSLGRGRQAIAFVRDPGTTHFSDGTAERDYTPEHDRHTLARAAALGLKGPPVQRHWGCRPYCPGGPLFSRLGERTWLATGGRKMGTVFGAAFAHRLLEELIRG